VEIEERSLVGPTTALCRDDNLKQKTKAKTRQQRQNKAKAKQRQNND
jgi:hypothetical protein